MSFLDSLNSIKNKVFYTKDVDFLDSKLSLGLLTMEDEEKISLSSTEEEGTKGTSDYFNGLKKRILSISIKSVDSDLIPGIVTYQGEDGTGPQKKTKELYLFDFLSKFPSVLVDTLFEAYLDFKEECGKNIEKEFKWEWYKTPEQREEEYQKRIKKQKNKDGIPEEDSFYNDEEIEEDVDPINFKEIKNQEDTDKGEK